MTWSDGGGLRNCDTAPFASFKKYASHFLNPDFVGTEPKDAAYAVTGLKSGIVPAVSFIGNSLKTLS
jgi:hypothetical protein